MTHPFLALLTESLNLMHPRFAAAHGRAYMPAEADEHEITHLPRLIMDFNRTNYGRLRQLIDAINRDG